MANEDRPVEKQGIYSGKILTLEKWTVELPNGKQALREIVHHKGAAAVVPVDERLRVPMVRQYRVAMGREMLEIPAGKMETLGEDPFDCAQRELAEETGLRASQWTYFGPYVASPGYCDEVVHLYMARGLTAGDTHLDEDEFLSVEWIPLSELLQQGMAGKIHDGKTMAALLLAGRALGL